MSSVFSIFGCPAPRAARFFQSPGNALPTVRGDGVNTLESLVLSDERAVCLARAYAHQLGARWYEILPAGGCLRLTELGSHCRGAIFLDGAALLTAPLEAAIEHVSQSFQGFYFGRYDLRAASVEAFQQGRFKIIELNGVTAEATHIYDPRYRVWQAYRVLFAQWRLAFAIGQANEQRGARVYRAAELFRMLQHFSLGIQEDHKVAF